MRQVFHREDREAALCDILGESGREILEALVDGYTDAAALAE
jgi:hypothetical protein